MMTQPVDHYHSTLRQIGYSLNPKLSHPYTSISFYQKTLPIHLTSHKNIEPHFIVYFIPKHSPLDTLTKHTDNIQQTFTIPEHQTTKLQQST